MSASILLVTATLGLTAEGRRAILVRAAALAGAAPGVRRASAAPVVLPLSLCGGAYCLGYSIDGQRFRAVADTGSPFALVDGTCDDRRAESPWGCYRGTGRETGLDDTEESFGGQDVGVQWRTGELRLLGDAGEADGLPVPNATFGIVRTYVGKGGSGAPFLGLARRRLPRLRPTLLEQTAVRSLRFRFLQRSLTLSDAPLLPRAADAVPLLDLTARGAPAGVPACRVARLWVNGVQVRLDRPCVAVLDTGTTGLALGETLYCSGGVPLPVRDARVELRTERGRTCALEASVRRAPRPSRFGDVPLVYVPPGAAELEAFPLVVTSVAVPWWEADAARARGAAEAARDEAAGLRPFEACAARAARAARRGAARPARLADGLGVRPHVLFVGLAFLWRRELTVDPTRLLVR